MSSFDRFSIELFIVALFSSGAFSHSISFCLLFVESAGGEGVFGHWFKLNRNVLLGEVGDFCDIVEEVDECLEPSESSFLKRTLFLRDKSFEVIVSCYSSSNFGFLHESPKSSVIFFSKELGDTEFRSVEYFNLNSIFRPLFKSLFEPRRFGFVFHSSTIK